MLDNGMIECGDQRARIDHRLRINAGRGTRHDVAEMIDAWPGGGQPSGLKGRQHRGRRYGTYGADLQVGPIRDLDRPIPTLLGEVRHHATLLTGQHPTGCPHTRDDAILRRNGVKEPTTHNPLG
jgi:hypothetical protein